MIRNLAITTAAALALLCAHEAGASPKGKRVAMLTTSSTHPFTAAMSRTMVEKAKAHGMDVTIFASQFNPATQAQQVDDAIARKFDLLAILAVSEKGIIPPLNRAKQAGIPVVLVTAMLPDEHKDLYVSFVGEDPYKLGMIAGQAVMKALKEGGQDGGRVAMITGSLQEGVAPLRVNGFREAIKSNPKIQVVAVEDAKWDTATSERIAGQLFARFASQGGLDAMYGMADNQAAAIIQAAEAANIPLGPGKGRLTVVGSNCVGTTVGLIKAGKQYSSASQIPTRVGEKAIEVIADHFNGKPLEKKYELPAEMISRENIDQWVAPCTF
jgi:ribose transport system substrate-binding protein